MALSGAWAGGGMILSSYPLAVAPRGADPFALLDGAPVEPAAADVGDAPAVGGAWLGWLGFPLGRRLERTPPPPPRDPPGLAPFDLAFHDHLVRRDARGDWWFEALWTDARGELLSERLRTWSERLAAPPPPATPFAAEPLRPRAPGLAGHATAVGEVVERIAAGELSQANLCLRFEAGCSGHPLELWVSAVAAADPAYAAYVGGEHTLVSLSPELFLRRRGRQVQTRPVKGTAPRDGDPAALAASAKDRAENVMIVDLMRNDLGRVCEYGSVAVTELHRTEPAAGVWHLVSTVTGRLRDGVGDGALLRATFPPGSVTGAPKVQALRVISALEASAREAYCGAIGLCSPLAGLELSVAIRTLEVAHGRLWLGAGGGIVGDSDPAAEVSEALAKAAGAVRAAGLELGSGPAAPSAATRAAPLVAPLAAGPRPDPAAGVFETVRVSAGLPVAAAAHLGRLRAGCAACGLPVPAEVEAALARAASELTDGGVRIAVAPGGVTVTTRAAPAAGTTALRPVVLPGGLGAHKWLDRALVDSLTEPGVTPLLCDLDGTVLEAGYAAVLIWRGGVVIAPPLDGRLLPSVSRALALARAGSAGLAVAVAPFTLAQAREADAVVLCSSLRGPHPGLLAGGPGAGGARELCAALAGPARPAN